MAHGASALTTSERGDSALAPAIWDNRLDSVEVLLPLSPLETQDEFGDTPLIVAALEGRTEIAQRLIAAKANVNHRDKNGSTALIEAAKNGNEALVRALLEAGADTKPRTERENRNAAEWAEALEHGEVAQVIRARGKRAA